MKIIKSILIGIATAIIGLIFSALFGKFFNGLSMEASTILGMLFFLCVVIVVCTGILLSKMDQK